MAFNKASEILFICDLLTFICDCFSRIYQGISSPGTVYCGDVLDLGRAVSESEMRVVCVAWSGKFTFDVNNGWKKSGVVFHIVPCYLHQMP